MTHDVHKPTFLLLQARLPRLEPGKFIGRFVTHPARPLDNFAPQDPAAIIGDEIVVVEERRTKDVLQEVKNIHAQTALEGLVKLGAQAGHKDVTNVQAPCIKTYRLQNQYKAFDKLEIDGGVREALDGPKGLFTRSKGKLYMITGFKTCAPETAFKATHAGGIAFNAQLTIPMSALVSGLPFNVLNPTVGGGVGLDHHNFHQFTTASEQIFAVEYKIVKQRNILGMYSPNAETVIAHDPLTHRWNNAMYSGDEKDEEIEGIFDDDEVDGGGDGGGGNMGQDAAMATSEKETFDQEIILNLVDEPLSEADLQGADFLTVN